MDGGRKVPKRLPHLRHDDQGHPSRERRPQCLSRLLHDAGGRAGLDRLLEKSVAVEALAAHRREGYARRDLT